MFGLDYWHIAVLVVVPATLVASAIDYRARKVPNWLNAGLAAAGLAVQSACFGLDGLITALLGLAVGLAVLIVPWAMHGMGAGDVKLMAAIGAWFGPLMTLVAFAAGAVIGGIIAVVMILAGGRLGLALVNFNTILVKCGHAKTAFGEFGSVKSFGQTTQLLPYGIPLTIGSLIVLAGQVLGWWVL